MMGVRSARKCVRIYSRVCSMTRANAVTRAGIEWSTHRYSGQDGAPPRSDKTNAARIQSNANSLEPAWIDNIIVCYNGYSGDILDPQNYQYIFLRNGDLAFHFNLSRHSRRSVVDKKDCVFCISPILLIAYRETTFISYLQINSMTPLNVLKLNDYFFGR